VISTFFLHGRMRNKCRNTFRNNLINCWNILNVVLFGLDIVHKDVYKGCVLYKFWFCTDINVAFEPNLKIFGRFRQNQPNLPNMWNKITYFLSEKKFKKILKGQEGKIRTGSSQPYTWNIFFWTKALNVTCNTIFFGLGTHCSAWKTWSFLTENGLLAERRSWCA